MFCSLLLLLLLLLFEHHEDADLFLVIQDQPKFTHPT